MKPVPKKLRTEAEKLLATTRRDVAQMPVEDVQKLVHELQVHQIELEMQNGELRRTQLELEAARERLLLPYDAAPVGFLTLDAKGVICEANLAAARLLNFDRVTLAGKKMTQFIAPASQDIFYLHRRQLLNTGEKQTCELNLLRTASPPFIARLESVMENAGPEPVARCLVMMSDITEQKQAEAALQQAHDQLEQRVRERTAELSWANTALRGEKAFSDSLIELAPAVIAVVDVQGNLIRTNAYTEQFTGYPFAETQGQDMVKLFVPEAEQPRLRRLLGETLRGQSVRAVVAPLRTRDGEIRHIEWFTAPLAKANGEPSALLAIGQDITERRQAEEALRETSQLNRQIITDASEGIIVYDHDLKYQVWNPFMEELTGVPAADVLGKSAVEVFPFLQGAGVIEQLRRVLAGADCAAKEFPFLVPQSGRSGWASDTNAPLRNVRGEIIGVIGMVTDITERKNAEERIVRLNRALAIRAEVGSAIVRLADQQPLLDEICRVAVEKGGFKLAWVGLVTPDKAIQPVAKAGATGYLKGIRIALNPEVPEGREPVGEAIRTNRPVVVMDIARDPRMVPWRDRARKFGLHFAAVFPIRIGDQVAGSFHIYAAEANFFDEREQELMNQVSQDISFALTALDGLAARKQAEAALIRSEHHLSNFFNQAPIGLVWLSASGTVLRANQTQLDLLGCSAEEYMGHSFLEFCTEASHGHELLEQLAKKETVRNLRMTRKRKDGAIVHVLVDANSFWSENEFQHSSVFLRDITDRLKLEREVLHVSEREHRRIAQDLHDGLGQLLVGTVYLINTLQKDLAAKSVPEARRLTRIMEVINEAIWQTRNLARGLHPVEPEPNGLMAALETLAVRTKKMFRVPCHFTCRRPVLVTDNAVVTHLFRIAQEAVTNAIKHASPGNI